MPTKQQSKRVSTYGLRDADECKGGERYALVRFVRAGETGSERGIVALRGDHAKDDHDDHDYEHHQVADRPDDPGRELPAQLGDEEGCDAERDGAEEEADGALAHPGVVGVRLAAHALRLSVVDLPAHPVGVVLDEGEPRELRAKRVEKPCQSGSKIPVRE